MLTRRTLIATASLATLSLSRVARSADDTSPWRAGVNYRLLENPQPTNVAPGKIEVIEVFWYGCGHCFALDPALEDWNGRKPDFIEFVRVPVFWQGPARQHAKLYYILQSLHRLDLHPVVFRAIHVDGIPLVDRDEMKARALQFAFLSRHGVTQQQFDTTYDSMSVAVSLQRSENLTRALRIDSVPALFVNGKYATSVSEAGGESQLLSLLTNLAEREKR